MYLLDVFLLLIFVYLVPGLVFFPGLLADSRHVYALPVISAGVVYLCVTLLQALGIYDQHHVIILVAALSMIAMWRARKALLNHRYWPKQARWLMTFLVMVMIPYFIKLGTQGFEQGDEIYSWNFWAIQHTLNQAIDFSHTSATYPQLFPKLLSFCYVLLGDIQLQCPVKATLGLFPLAMLGAWGSVMSPMSPRRIFFFLALLLYVLAGLKLEQFFNDGYADPIMTSALVVSMALLINAVYRDGMRFQYLFLSVFAGLVACFTKQPAFLWAVMMLPGLLFYLSYQNKDPWIFCLGLLSVCGALVWFGTEGRQFYNNHGVVYLSFEGRGWVEQFFHVSYRYLIAKPLILGLFIGSYFLIRRSAALKSIYVFFVLPELFLWLMFGAYQLRLGQHLIAVCALMCAFGLKTWSARVQWGPLKKTIHGMMKHQHGLMRAGMGLCVIASTVLLVKTWKIDKPGIDLKQGGRVSLQRYFNKDAQKVYDQIYTQSDNLLWVPTSYLYGIFYEHTGLIRPDYSNSPYTQKHLITQLKIEQPDFVFTVGEEVADGPASSLLAKTIETCPKAFEVFSSPPNKYHYTTYKVNKDILCSDPCLDQV